MGRLTPTALAAILVVACSAPSASPTQAGPTALDTDCTRFLGMSGHQASEELAAVDIEPSWRLEYTDSETGPVAEEATSPPEGVVTNIVASGSEVVVFVSPVDDPLREFTPESLICPWQ